MLFRFEFVVDASWPLNFSMHVYFKVYVIGHYTEYVKEWVTVIGAQFFFLILGLL